jgi:hypothetical protein
MDAPRTSVAYPMPSDAIVVVEHEDEDDDSPFSVEKDCDFDGQGQPNTSSATGTGITIKKACTILPAPASHPFSRWKTLIVLFVGAVAVIVGVTVLSSLSQHQHDYVPAAATAFEILPENPNANSIGKMTMEGNGNEQQEGQLGAGVRLRRRLLFDAQEQHMTAVMDEFETLRQHWSTATATAASTDAATVTTETGASDKENSNDQEQQQQGKPFFGDGNQVHVLQIGDEAYRKLHEERMSVNRDWAKCAGYQYAFKSFENHENHHSTNDRNHQTPEQPPCVYTKKVKAIRDFLVNDIPLNDWMIFVDLDATYQAPDCQALEKLLWKEQHHYNFHAEQQHDPHQCEVLALMTESDLNTGIFLVKATEQTRELMETWYQWQMRHGWCKGPADQLTLQEAMLEHYHIAVTSNAAASAGDQQCDYSLEDCYLAHETATSSYRKRRDCSIHKLNAAREESLTRDQEWWAPTPSATGAGYSYYAPSTLPVGNNACFFEGRSPTPLQCHYVHEHHDTCMKHHPLFNHVQKFRDEWS